MKRLIILAICGLTLTRTLWAADDFMQFYQEEAKVVSGSRIPHAENETPATVYTVTQEDIKASGALTIPDALRGVPGLNVMETRTGQSELGIRGINRALNSRTLVLLDGQSVFNPYFDFVNWESLPVHMDEIERIEVIEGPASAIYGADALSGVVNIITKRPEQLNGTQLTYKGGERNTQRTDMTFGKKIANNGVRVGASWDSTNRFSDASLIAAKANHFDGEWNHQFTEKSSLDLTGGYSNFDSNLTTGLGGTDGPFTERGERSLLHATYKILNTLLQAGWSHARSTSEDNSILSGSHLDYDTLQAGIEQNMTLWQHNKAVIGGSYERQHAQSSILQNGRATQDLWSMYAEDRWEFTNKLMLLTSARVDRHPLTPIQFSPRGSLLYTPIPEQVFRISAGTSYRNPTLIENYLNALGGATPNPGIFPFYPPNPPFKLLGANLVGNQNLDPENLQSVEIAHTGTFGRLKTTVTGYRWDARNGITNYAVTTAPGPLPQFNAYGPKQSFTNVNADSQAWGGELGLDYTATQWLKLLGDYSYIYAYGSPLPVQPARHQANAGFRTHAGGFTTQWMVQWVDSPTSGYPLPAYFLVNAHVGYAFAGPLSGLEVGINAFNLLNHDHYEFNPLQSAEIVKGRFSGTVSYKF